MRAASGISCEAAVFTGARQVHTQRIVVPDPGPGQIRVRLEGCGVCASNLPVWDGRPWFQYPCSPGSPGHEGWGIVEALGDSVTGFAIGDRVALLSSHAFAEYELADCDCAVRIPPSLHDQPVPGEPLGCAMNIFRRADIREGQRVAIVGIGFLGAMLTDLCVRAGAKVVALSRRPFAREVAERYGASAAIDLQDLSRSAREARRHTQDAGFERVIEAVGNQEALDLATELVGTRATLVIAGYHQDAPRRVDMQRWNWLGLDVVNAHERDPGAYRRGMREAMALMEAGTLKPASLFTHRFSLAEIGEGFRSLAERPHGFIKALVTCEGHAR
jgi:threonine dehydrogenase-like Zn-dependent dehydrogenase